MKALTWLSATAAVIVMTAACGNDNASPAAPTPPPVSSAAVTIDVTSAAATGSSFQLTATARMADGSSRDVTGVATWQSSNINLATVTSAGFVTVVGTGEVELRATYAGVTGSMHVTVRGPQTYSFTGVVAELAPKVHGIAGARVQIVVGPHTFSDTNGVFSLYGLPAGRTILEVTKDGYVTYSNQIVIDRDVQMQINLYPTPP